jgi:hypothetical protein
MAETARRIHSKGPFTREEYDAGEAGIYPGMLLKLASDGDVEIHDDENGRAEALFAEEDASQGKTVDDVYIVDNVVSCILPQLGCEIRALIQDGQDISIGDRLVSAGDGTLKALGTLDSEAVDVFVIAVAMEACDLSGSNSSNTLCRVRITAGN